jgi:hypothetical protein
MGKKATLLASLILSFSTLSFAQSASDYALQLNVSTQVSPPQIRLQWKKLSGATGYTIDRKGKNESSWTHLVTANATDSTYIDASVIADSAYEYRVVNTGGSATGTGYIYAGVRAPAQHTRGGLILLVDTTFVDSCKAEIAQLMNDLRGDGWMLIRKNIGRSQSPTAVRNIIRSECQSHSNVQALFILGHVAVPYSGDINPDGHPDHLGAWPADVFYADIDGTWTDNTVNDNVASRTQNKNVPGDGKWDQTYLPSEAELQCGRVDFANMPAISRSEFVLMRNYLNKAHTYKMNQLSIIRKGLIDDNFGAFSGEAFSANAWRLFPTVVGKQNIVSADYVGSLNDSAYQWSYGCGGGSYNSAGGIGVTNNFDTSKVKGIFSMLFGSYFGDWDAQNNFLRAPLCAPDPALTNCWAGRPNWFLHHMALGENIGYGTRLTQNNNISVYEPGNYGVYWIHVALMGDPSLRTDYMLQPKNLAVSTTTNGGSHLTWTASTEPGVIGYYVYRCDSAWGQYQRISGLLTSTTFNDVSGTNGKKFYLLRPAKLQQTPSGGYYNLGVGIVDSAVVTYPLAVAGIQSKSNVTLFPNPASKSLNVSIEIAAPAEARMQLMNASGQILKSEIVHLNSGENSFQWDVEGWPEGLYMLMIQTENEIITRKWVKVMSR